MATMVKVNAARKNKKKSTEKCVTRQEPEPVAIETPVLEDFVPTTDGTTDIESKTDTLQSNTMVEAETTNISIEDTGQSIEEENREQNIEDNVVISQEITESDPKIQQSVHTKQAQETETIDKSSPKNMPSSSKDSYKELSNKLERITIPNVVTEIAEERENELVHSEAYLNTPSSLKDSSFVYIEDVLPSAPCFQEIPQPEPKEEVIIIESKPKVKCMPIEDAMRLCGGKEMEEIRAMSEREQVIVEAGALSGPEHPLVDLLSTFRSSLIAVERERIQLANGFADEEKHRHTLWKIEWRHLDLTKKCDCGLTIDCGVGYKHAELQKEKLPVAKMKLESLLRDVQDSYCHHQHAALLAHCQIEELVGEAIQSNTGTIREALTLILQALRLSDNAPAALASALQRWAVILSAALLDGRDLRQLLFLMHHLFRQSRSVQWASLVVHAPVAGTSPWRVLALLHLLLSRTRTDTALECTEETEDAWEEVDEHGGSGAVSEGTLRERDLLALLDAFPLRDLVARLVLFTHSDVRQARANEWGDPGSGRGVVRACGGVRALLHVLRHAHAHADYVRLHQALRELAARALHALACLHLVSRPSYAKELEDKISAELEAAFVAGFHLFCGQDLDKLPTTLLDDDTTKDYCISIIVGIHDTSPKQLQQLSIELPVLTCAVRIRIVSQAAIDRTQDHELARIVLEFLLQTGLKRKSVSCPGLCEATAREWIARLLAAHPYLHTTALRILTELNVVETLDPSCVKTLIVNKWRPNCMEITSILDDWARRCQQFLQHLLLEMNYTPYVGLPLEVQLTIGSWLCSWVLSLPKPSIPEWCWSVLRRMRVHRTCWNMSLDAPAPDSEPTDLFSTAFALMATSYGHCIPVICSEGVLGLCKLATSRPRDAVQCLAGVMLVMAQSPESVTLTPKFSELLTILVNSGPTLMQRALGRGGVAGSELLLRLILAQLSIDGVAVHTSGVLSAWLHLSWRAALPAAAGAMVDAAATATRLWPQLDAYADTLMQEENAKEHINYAVRNAATAPLLCELLLRACHAVREVSTHVFTRLLSVLHQQRVKQQKIHVDNALQKLGVSVTSEELVIYRCASAVLVAPISHPAHLTLWRLLMHLYLQTPPNCPIGSTPVVGPLFFSGLVKSRTLAQMKRRILETITYHRTQAETLKNEHKSIETTEKPSTIRVEKALSVEADDSLLPALSMNDFIGEQSEVGGVEENADSTESTLNPEAVERRRNIFNLIIYHAAAEKLLNQYLCWLEDGEKVQAAPHCADIARFIPEHALEAAWNRAVSRPPPSIEPDSFPLPVVQPPPDNSPPQTPFHIAVDNILKIKDGSQSRQLRPTIKPCVEDVDFRDVRTLKSLVEKHLKDIEKLAQEWCTEVGRISSLDSRLWELVSALYVRCTLPPVRKHCANKCAPVSIYVPVQEYCISAEAERCIKENRSNARAALRRLVRARPQAARTAAALHAIARRTRSSEAGLRVVERAWRVAVLPHSDACVPARCVLTALVEELAERWICHDGRLCADLLSGWGKRASTPLQQTLCGALLSPRRLPAADWYIVYTALLDTQLPPHTVFSYLSRFEMIRWSELADSSQRRDILEAVTRAVQRMGPAPAPEQHMLVELLGVHSAVLLDARELSAHVMRCVAASVDYKLPPDHWAHVVRAINAKATEVPFDQLGHLLRSVGVQWWEVRTGMRGARNTPHATYAPHVALLLRALRRAFVLQATKLSYEPERVAWYAWPALLESWGAWISPHPAAPPLLSSTADNEAYTPMLRNFVEDIHQIMLECPGTEIHLLQQTFEWCVQTYMSVQGSPSTLSVEGGSSQESRVQASALLVELSKLPWSEHKWFYGKCLQQALQISSSTDRELTSWCCSCWRGTLAETMLRDIEAGQLVPHLASLLYLFTGTQLQHSPQILNEACKLPWYRLPELALDEALDRFFTLHHNPEQAYHDLPQFRLILVACSLCVTDASPARSTGTCRAARALCVSQWVRAACAATLSSHVPAHTAHVLGTVTSLAPHLSDSEDELEDLLGRAIVIMCIEPAASAALPIWLSWISKCPPRLVRACVSAVATLTVFEHFATLADATVRALLMCNEAHGWRDVIRRLSPSPWREAASLSGRAYTHAAYACVLTHAHSPDDTRATLAALLTADIHFVQNEAIIAVWICYACRVALSLGDQSDAASECGAAARALLAQWAEPPRRSILRVVTMQVDTNKPTALHRLLCRYAQCVLTPDEASRRAYDSACTATLGANNDVTSYAGQPHLSKLVRLANRLWPKHEKYFQYELEMMNEDNVVSN